MRGYIYRIIFMRQSETKDAVGQKIQTWAEVTNRLANIHTESAKEFLSRSAELSQTTTKIYVRRDSVIEAITVRDKIYYGTKQYNITGILDTADQRRGDILFLCQLTV